MGGKEKKLAFGAWPDVPLADARRQRDEARAILAAGRDPGVDRRQRRALLGSAADSFETVARAWHKLQMPQWTEAHAADVLRSLERDVFPELGSMPLKEITAPLVLSVLRAIEARPAIETAHRVRQRMSAVFVYGIAAGVGENDPAAIVERALAREARAKAVR